ncbi:hypothetical protein L486_04815 [Kwoniella mangroviensis CBS 10435]|uniref:Uncharacterized protein n=1 Tax=Kwoniella mangroviensis CBS 10435 TaxID=1331196 RepID=A0A1B9IP58_9TREE|nr:hypothetical protein L486_04815 [Kwoniella mangroviensis CBS 10435]
MIIPLTSIPRNRLKIGRSKRQVITDIRETSTRTTQRVAGDAEATTRTRDRQSVTGTSRLVAVDNDGVARTSKPTDIPSQSSIGEKQSVPPILNSFPPNFPVDTPQPVLPNSSNRGYMFMKDQQVLDSTSDHRRKGKVDNVIMEDMKWAEGREVIERKIIWENGTDSIKSKNGGSGGARRSFLGLGSGLGKGTSSRVRK